MRAKGLIVAALLVGLLSVPCGFQPIQQTAGSPLDVSSSLAATSTWQNTTVFPVTSHPSCATSSGYVYCIGGSSPMVPADTYYAQLSSTGVSAWEVTASYPIADLGQTCVTSGSYIYCVGGSNTNDVYYAQLSSSGLSPWRNTTAFPKGIGGDSCAAASGFVYCMGWDTDEFYYAHLSSSGVSTWNATTTYPESVRGTSCVASGGYIYCVGGEVSPFFVPTSSVYYARITSSGIGAWTNSDSFPLLLSHQSCMVTGSSVYCVGGDAGLFFTTSNSNAVYYATLSSSGVSPWVGGEQFPIALADQTCVASGGYIYCVVIPAPDYTLPSPVYYLSAGQPGAASNTSTVASTGGGNETSQEVSASSATSLLSTKSSVTSTSSQPSSSSLPPSYVALVGAATALLTAAVLGARRRRSLGSMP